MTRLLTYPGHELLLTRIVRADNCDLFDADGVRYVDLESGVWCTPLGAAVAREVVRTIRDEQLIERSEGTPVPFNPPPRLVTGGPYGCSRNPMLTGVFLFLFGLGFAVNSVSLVLFFVPLFILVNVWELKEIEEPELVKRLGDEYTEYRKRTPMFIPKLCRGTRAEDPVRQHRDARPNER